MLTHVRMSVPDRPGLLAQITAALADAGADIRTITVLERESGRAVDDVYVSWPDARPLSALTERIESVRGVTLLGVRPSREVPGAFPDLDLLTQVLATGDRGLHTLVDMAVLAFGADWAASVSFAHGPEGTDGTDGPDGPGHIVYASGAAADDVVVPKIAPIRPVSIEQDGVQLAIAPLAPFDAVLVCGRAGKPAFHAAELERIRRVTELALELVHAKDALPSS